MEINFSWIALDKRGFVHALEWSDSRPGTDHAYRCRQLSSFLLEKLSIGQRMMGNGVVEGEGDEFEGQVGHIKADGEDGRWEEEGEEMDGMAGVRLTGCQESSFGGSG